MRDFEAVQKTRGHALSGLKLSVLPRVFKPGNAQIFSNSKIHENNGDQWIDYKSWKNIRAKRGSVNCRQFSSALWNLNTFMHQPIIATCVEVQMGKGLGVDSGESASAKVAQELWDTSKRLLRRLTVRGLGRDGEVNPVFVSNISFQQQVYRLQVHPTIGQLWKVTSRFMSIIWLWRWRV